MIPSIINLSTTFVKNERSVDGFGIFFSFLGEEELLFHNIPSLTDQSQPLRAIFILLAGDGTGLGEWLRLLSVNGWEWSERV